MKKHICVNQSNMQELGVPPELVTKLYTLIKRTENGEEVWDAMDGTNIETSLCGSFKTGYTYEEYINKINEYFGNTLSIIADGYYILFEDSLVRDILVNSSLCENHIGITSEDIRKLTSLGELINNTYTPLFRETNIVTFDELSKLTNLTKINNYDFYGCTHLRSIDLTNIRDLGMYAFQNCTSLDIDVNMPNLVNHSGGAFMGSNIKSVINLGSINTIAPKSQTGRDDGMFEGCTNLESVHLSELITEIGKDSFRDCTALKNINIPIGLTSIKSYAFANCQSLTLKILYAPNVINIGNFIFSGSSIDIVYLNSLKTMQNDGKNNNSGYYNNSTYYRSIFATDRGVKTYKYLYFRDIEYFEPSSFARCNVNSLIINNETPPAAPLCPYNNRIFVSGSVTNIYVPASAVEVYKSHSDWSYYADNIKSIELMPKVATYEQFLEKQAEGDTTLYLIEEYM